MFPSYTLDSVNFLNRSKIKMFCDHQSLVSILGSSGGFYGEIKRKRARIVNSLFPSFTTRFVFVICIFFLLPAPSISSPARSPVTCGRSECKADTLDVRDLKFHFKAGSVYNYLYTVNGTILADGGPPEQSGLHFSANTTIHFLTACDAILYMKDVELWQSVLPSGQDDIHKHHFSQARTRETFKESLEQFPLRFAFAEGLIEEICPEKRENAWVLNIKRGLLSAFQNTMRRLDLEHSSHEDDVNGRCGVQYRIGEATSSTMTIERIKDINSCGDKFGTFSTIQGMPYTFGKLQQSMPAVESWSGCNQVVDRNLLVEIECSEKHRLRPLSSGVSGVHININQHLDLVTVYSLGNSTEEDGPLQNAGGRHDDDDGFGLDDFDDDEDEKDDMSEKDSSDFSRVENAGTFLIFYKADAYISEIISRKAGEISRRDSLHFQHEYSEVGSATNDYKGAASALTKFCQAVKVNEDGSAGVLFESLVQSLRGLSTQNVMHLSREFRSLCDGDRSLFDNVVEAVGTAASVGVIKERIFNGDAPRETISSWINSLGFIPRPDLELMEAAFPILRARDNYPNILLSYSSLAHSFCRHHSSCSQHQPVHKLSWLYEKFFNLTGCVTKHRKNVDQVLMYLKGIGNFGMFDDGIHTALQTCIGSNDRSEIRVAAIEAYRRMPCSDVSKVHGDLQQIFERQEDDAEVRIAAFLAIMKCPTYPTIGWLKRVMEREEVRQVTSFVSSYIRNVQESALPSKLELQGLVADEKFNDPFHTDFRQFSKNYEVSAFYPDGNFGMGLDSNLIFSQDSYIPRSSSLNLTVDLFGESINIFEATVRLESFEHYVESIFGPNGKLSGTGIERMVSSLLSRREKRAVPSKRKMRNLALEYDAMRRYYSDPIVSLSLKTLGRDVAFWRKVGLDEQVESLSSLNPFQFLEKLSNTKDSNWQKTTMLFDSSYIIPTGVGLPLNLSAHASSIMRFQAESMIDATNFRANPFQLKLKGKLVPSALVTASAGVSLSAFQSHAGMKVRAQLRSSTALEGSFEMRGSELFDVDFGVPKTRLELLEFKSDVLFLQKDVYREVGRKRPKLSPACNLGILYKYMGLKLCSKSHFVLSKPSSTSRRDDDDDHGDNESDNHSTLSSSAPFLINGPSYFSLTLDKSNPNLLKTRFHYQWNNNETNTDFKLRTIKTTGTVSNQREDELGINYLLDKKEKSFSLDVNVPGSTAKASGQLKEERGVLKLDVVDKNTGQPYTGGSISLDSVTFEDEAKGTSKSYSGTGDVYYKNWEMQLTMQGSRNLSHFVVECKGNYRNGASRSSTIAEEKVALQISTATEEQRKHGQLLGTITDRKLAVDFSQFPDYNTLLIWKSQISEDGYENDLDFRQGRNYLTVNDPTTFRIQASAHHGTNHEKTGVKWMFLASQPSQETDWGVEASFNSHGKSFDSAISFRYAPGKMYGTSVSLQRKPGVMLFLNFDWNVTIPSRPPFQIMLHLDESAPRVYQAQYKMSWFGTNDLGLEIEFSDRSRRNKLDTTCMLILTTKTIDNLKLGFHFLSEEKETKLQLNSEYSNRRNAFEAGHILNGGSKHKFYGSVTTGEVVYLVMSEIDLEHGIQLSLQTDLGPTFSDIQVRVKATNQNGLRNGNFEYSWDFSRDSNKKFVLELTLDSSKANVHRFEGIVMYPGYNYHCDGHYRYDKDDRSRVVMGRLKWKDEEHLHVNAQLVPRISDHEAYDVLLEVATPFELVKNVSFNAGVQLFNERRQCLVTLDGSWGVAEKLQGTLESHLESLDISGSGGNSTAVSSNDEAGRSLIPFKYSLQGNLTSTVEGLQSLRINLQHSQFSELNCKTDLDIQLANEKEISVTNHLVVPDSFSDLLSTRLELHIKTPFVGYQNMDLQAILGRKEDKDVMALIGIYVENFQYSIAITGTPRFEEDGALGFELTTSNPKYDKIFGSFSYVIGDNSRLACQLGWPQVVVGLEAGLESSGWEEFQLYLTFTSPWMPVKNINTLVKIDRAQFAEIKFELNEDGINAKSEWVIESWTSFDVRLDGSTPFTGARTFGGVLKHSWDDPAIYYSQISGWVDDHQAGYKLEGGTSEKEEECGFATVRVAQLEVDTVVYPTVRTTLNLVQMDIKHNLEMSIVVREGPINVLVDLEVLDVSRFNEKIVITTPYPALFELEINLNPAIVPQRELYNLGLHSKWRSGADWEEGGLVIRLGPQNEYVAIVTEDLENKAFLECGPSEGDEETNEGGDDYGTGRETETAVVTPDLPNSQLFHFYSPLKWANVVKLEYEPVSESPDSDVDGESENSPDGQLTVDQFPVRNFALVYQATNATFSTILQNGAKRGTFSTNVDIRTLSDRLACQVDCVLDLSEMERKLSVRAISHHPTQQEYSLTSEWNNQLPQYFRGNVEVSTPIDKLEQQSVLLTYAENKGEQCNTVDVEFTSITFDKLGTTVVHCPRHFSMTLNTPLDNYKEIELRADTKESEENPGNQEETTITLKNGEKEIEIDLVSHLEDGWPSKVQGTISATLDLTSPARQGNLTARTQKHNDYRVDVEGEINWDSGKQLLAEMNFDFPVKKNHLETFRGEVNTTIEGLKYWQLEITRNAEKVNGLEYAIQGETPYSLFSTFNGNLIFEKEDDWLEVKKLLVSGDAPSGSFSVESNWALAAWNNFEMNGKGKYTMGEEIRSSFEALATLPESNMITLSIGNKIPTLGKLTSVDSKALLKLQEPRVRVGQTIKINYEPDGSPTLSLTSSSLSTENSKVLSVNASFDDKFQTLEGFTKFKSFGNWDRIYEVEGKWETKGAVVDAEAAVEWGSQSLGTVSVHGTFNCSVSDASDRLFHVRIGSPQPKQSGSSEEKQGDGERADGVVGEGEGNESGEEQENKEGTTSLVNPLVNPMVTIDGTFNKISGLHSARVQFGQDELDEPPLIAQTHVHFVALNEFDALLNFTSNIENFTKIGLHVGHKFYGNTYNGSYGGQWEEDEAMLSYYVEYENAKDMLFCNASLFAVIPISMESAPRPQRAGVDVFYKGEAERLENAFRGEYNGVQLLRTVYKSEWMSSAGVEKENRQLEFDNHFWPFGFNHTYQFSYSGGVNGHNLPTKLSHLLDLFSLHNSTEQRFEGEMIIGTNFTGQQISMQGAHPTRKMYFITDYNWGDQELSHWTKFSWRHESEAGYELILKDLSKDEGVDHQMSLKVNYPIRKIEVESGYTIANSTFTWTTELNLNASRSDDKIVSTFVCSKEPDQNKDVIGGKAVATLRHPSLPRDMIAAGELTMVGLTASSSSPGRGRIDGIFSVEYSDDPTQRLILNWDAKLDFHEIVYWWRGRQSNSGGGDDDATLYSTTYFPYWELETNGKLEHLVTSLHLKALYSTQHSPHELSIITLMDFKNGLKNASQESKMAFELLKESKQASLQMSDPEGYALFWGQLSGQYPEFVVNGKMNVTGISPGPEANISVDLSRPYFKMYAVHGKDLMDGVFGEGGVVDSRNVFFDISESYNNYKYSDVNIYLRLNHSRLITSKLTWRPELFGEIRDLCVNLYRNATEFAGAKWSKMCSSLSTDGNESAHAVWKQMEPNLAPFFEIMKKDLNFTADAEALRILIVEMYDKNELHLRDIHDYVQLVAEEVAAKLKASFERYRRDLGNPGQLLEKAFAWVVDQCRQVYNYLSSVWNNYVASGGEGLSKTLAKLRELFFMYLNEAIEMAERLIIQIYQSLSAFTSTMYGHISHLVERYQPSIMAYLHQLETAVYSVVNKILDFFYETKEAVVRSPYYHKLTKLAEDLDQIYRDLSKNNMETNFNKYYGILRKFVMRKLSELANLKLSLGKLGDKLEYLVGGILQTEVAQDLKGAIATAFQKLKYLIRYTELDVFVPKLVLTLISKGTSIFFQTAIDTAASLEQPKTKFYFEPKKGIVSLEQKLPMPLTAFNETPDFRELPEYRALLRVQNLFHPSDESWSTTYKKIASNPFNIIPPFEGHAMVIGSDYFFTFDGLMYNHSGQCVHLLTSDLVDGNFSVTIQYGSQPEDRGKSYQIIVASSHNTLIIDLEENGIKDPKRGVQQAVTLPVQMANLQAYRESEMLIVESPKGLTVSCNTVYKICQLKASGWYSRKVAGVLGTMDMEPFTDLMMASGKRAHNVSEVFNSWDVSDDSAANCMEENLHLPSHLHTTAASPGKSWCHRIFQAKHSSLESCFATVKADPFLEMCLSALGESQGNTAFSTQSTSVCATATAYASECRARGVSVKVPSGCIRCEMEGEIMMDRDMKVMSSPPSGSPATRSTDIVFIVEAKECNRALRTRRKIDTVVSSLQEELTKKGFKNVRYAAVVYGGDGVFDKPHPISQNGEIWTTSENIGVYATTAVMGNGNNDTFQAIWYSLHNLDFRPGVSKTFILFPCTGCSPQQMNMDFSTIHYAMLEQDAKLHILMNREFLFDSKNLAKKFFGHDSTFGYTKSDGMKGRLKGDQKITHQVFIPKRVLGYCGPLALKTNGTIFSGRKLHNRREKIVQLFTTVFSRRVVQTATPSDCQTCYCLPNDLIGVGRLECFVCSYPRYKSLPDDYDDIPVDSETEGQQGGTFTVDEDDDYEEEDDEE